MKLLGHESVFGASIEWLGRLGVMFFFVHTCTVLMMSLERSQGEFPLARTVGNFYLRRAFRIYPLSILAVCVAASLALPLSHIAGKFQMVGAPLTTASIVSNLLLIQNFYAKVDIIGVLWSLPLEVQMYLLLPLLYYVLARKGRMGWLLGIWCVAWAVAATSSHGNVQFYQHFLPGILVYILLTRVSPRLPGFLFPVYLAVLTTLFMAFHPSWKTGGIVCLAMGAALPFFKAIQIAPVNHITYNVAKYSYGIYLSHPFLLWFAFIRLSSLPLAARFSVFVVALVIVPVVLYRAIESPFIKVGSWLASLKSSSAVEEQLTASESHITETAV